MSAAVNRIKAPGLSVLLAVALFCGGASAATCSIVSATMSFGAYDGLSTNPRLASGVVRVSCTKDPLPVIETLTLTLQLLPSPTGAGGLRVINSGSSALPFDAFIDLLRTQRWGDGTQSTFTITGSAVLTTAIPTTSMDFPVYGRIPTGVSTPSGPYSALLNINLTY